MLFLCLHNAWLHYHYNEGLADDFFSERRRGLFLLIFEQNLAKTETQLTRTGRAMRNLCVRFDKQFTSQTPSFSKTTVMLCLSSTTEDNEYRIPRMGGNFIEGNSIDSYGARIV